MIEAVTSNTIDEILPLIRDYQTFYQIQDIDDDRNRRFFIQFSEHSHDGCQFLYRNSADEAVAFATLYFTFVTSITARVAVMNDLYTLPAYRGAGIGRQLINHCLQFALSKGAERLQWLTAEDNHVAQKLYDSLETKSRVWKMYTYSGSLDTNYTDAPE